MKKNKTLNIMIITALFIALSYAGTFISIPVGISKIHLGNFVCIIASLLCGGLIGGTAGGVGMALNDLTLGYGFDTILRTLIVKFLMGYIAGLLFRIFVKRKSNINIIYFLLTLLFSSLSILFIVIYQIGGDKISIGDRVMSLSPLLIGALIFISISFLIVWIMSNKIKPLQQFVLVSTSISLVLNIVLEFFLKIPLKMIFAAMSFESAAIYALSSLPGAVLTTILTIIFVTLIYSPIYFATERFNKFDNLYNEIQEITTFKK